MKILWLPLLYVAIPWVLAILLIKSRLIRKSALLNGIISFLLTGLTLWLTYLSLTTSIEGMRAKGIKCLTGVIVFPPIGIACLVCYYSIVWTRKRRAAFNE